MRQLTANERRSLSAEVFCEAHLAEVTWHSVTALPKRPVFILITSGSLFELLARLRRESAISQLR